MEACSGGRGVGTICRPKASARTGEEELVVIGGQGVNLSGGADQIPGLVAYYLVIVRELADGGNTLTLTGTLKITAESGTWTLRRVWRKRTS